MWIKSSGPEIYQWHCSYVVVIACVQYISHNSLNFKAFYSRSTDIKEMCCNVMFACTLHTILCSVCSCSHAFVMSWSWNSNTHESTNVSYIAKRFTKFYYPNASNSLTAFEFRMLRNWFETYPIDTDIMCEYSSSLLKENKMFISFIFIIFIFIFNECFGLYLL